MRVWCQFNELIIWIFSELEFLDQTGPTNSMHFALYLKVELTYGAGQHVVVEFYVTNTQVCFVDDWDML